MITQDELLEMKQEITLQQRRDYMKLSIEERRKILEAQAEKLAAHYESQKEKDERETWQGGDIIEF